jgi:hypothetical protein
MNMGKDSNVLELQACFFDKVAELMPSKRFGGVVFYWAIVVLRSSESLQAATPSQRAPLIFSVLVP